MQKNQLISFNTKNQPIFLVKMACRRLITSYAVSSNLKSVRSLPSLTARCYSTDPDEISKKTHTGQVKSHNNQRQHHILI